MTKLYMTLAFVSLTVSLAPAAHAYGVAPETSGYTTANAAPINVLFGAVKAQKEGICELNITPVLADALGLSLPTASDETTVALASCAPK